MAGPSLHTCSERKGEPMPFRSLVGVHLLRTPSFRKKPFAPVDVEHMAFSVGGGVDFVRKVGIFLSFLSLIFL